MVKLGTFIYLVFFLFSKAPYKLMQKCLYEYAYLDLASCIYLCIYQCSDYLFSIVLPKKRPHSTRLCGYFYHSKCLLYTAHGRLMKEPGYCNVTLVMNLHSGSIIDASHDSCLYPQSFCPYI